MTLLIDYQPRVPAHRRWQMSGVLEPGDHYLRRDRRLCALYGNKRFTFEGPSDLIVACDPHDLTEMIGNLIDNAGKWSREHVVVSLMDCADSVKIVVEDDGPGIPVEHRDSVFGVGTRVDEEKPGTGLGLAITYDLAALYGGRLWIDTSPLGGAAVNVTLTKISVVS